ncbi:hypothetical protein GX441_03250 [bacterium]|nr:hypothetical protein [bacterium]
MKRAIIICAVAFSVLFALDERLEKADEYYLNRHKDQGYSLKAKSLCDEVLKEKPDDAQALWRLARLYVLFGDGKSSKDEKISRYEAGRGYAEKAKGIDSKCAEAFFWYGVNIGRIGQTKGVLNSLSLAGPVKEAFEKALALNSKFAPAMDGLAVWYMEVPGVAGGDLNKSVEYLKKGIGIEPNYSLLYVDLAKVYIKQKNYSAARDQLKKCLAITAPYNPGDFYLDDKPEAEKLLKEIEGK